MVMTAFATFACELISYTFQIILFKLSLEIFSFIKIVLTEILFNSMIIIIIYPIIERIGMLLENIFAKDKILTRYY